MGETDADSSFHVSVHDVEPGSMDATLTALAALEPLVGSAVSLAVVPCWRGRELTAASSRVIAASGRADEVLLHGWTHRRDRRPGLVSLVTGRADEFAGLRPYDALERLKKGRDLLERLLDRPVRGFLAPAFRRGPVDAELAARAGLSYVVGWRRLLRAGADAIPLATSLWDLSRAAWGSRLGELGGRASALRRGALPVVAIHPVDVERGHLPRALALIRSLQDQGRSPIPLSALVAEPVGT